MISLEIRAEIHHRFLKLMNQSSGPDTTQSGDSNKFPPTLWTIVLEASDGDSLQSSEALRKLCETYHQPILAMGQKPPTLS
jgi:hypothetical protein